MPHRLAIIGHPIGHSLSPLFHATALRRAGLDGSYDALDVPPDERERTWHDTLRVAYTGFNITVPHKVAMVEYMDEVSAEVRATGAMNTAVCREGRWEGENTDVSGIRETLKPLQNRFEGASAVVIGNGGGARAVLHVLTEPGGPAAITVVGRDPARVRALVGVARTGGPEINAAGMDAEGEAAIQRAALVVQTTPVGMHPHTDARPLAGKEVFRPGQVVFDLIYRPRETRFIRDARQAGATVVGGLEMFLQQAAASFRTWTGVTPRLEEIRPIIEAALTTGET